jgi:hypothetical protein
VVHFGPEPGGAIGMRRVIALAGFATLLANVRAMSDLVGQRD